MENAAVRKFLDLVKADKSLESELQKQMMTAPSPEAALQLATDVAKAKGLSFSAGDLLGALPAISVPAQTGELSATDLDSVSGGRFWNWAKETTGSTTIACYICAMGTSG